MNKLFLWISEKFIPFSVLFFLVFIPLYPKLPLFDIVNTWVYIRLEDLLVAITAFVFVLLFWKKRQLPDASLTYPILLYWCIGFLVLIVSVAFVGRTVIDFHPHLVLLHFARRVEYMLFFFLGYYAVTRSSVFLRKVVWVLGATVFVIILYGLGQKFLGFPAFLTMNEEFAKGVPLRLPPTARIPSTFGGHYDLGAYLVFVIPILGSLVFGMKRVWQKLVFLTLAIGSLILLLFTASRISFGVYLVAICMMLIWQKRKRFIIPVVVVSIIIMNFVGVASERFYKTFRYENVIVDLSSGKPIGTLDSLEGSRATIEPIARPDEENLPKGSEFIGVQTDSSKQTSNVKTVEFLTSRNLASGTGEIATISGSFLIQKAFVYDISLTTRFQGQWPKAFAAFRRNVLFGSGFSTLSVASDGDYLRMLGETGILGTIAFLGIFVAAYAIFLRQKQTLDTLPNAFTIGTFAGLTGLLFNAVLIDVFEASKVAFSFWLMLGIALGLVGKGRQTFGEYIKLLQSALTHNIAYIFYLTILVISCFAFVLRWYFIADDFTWLKWATQTNIGNLSNLFTSAQGFFYRPIPKLWYFVLYSLFWLKPGPYHFMSLVLAAISTMLVFFISKKEGVRTWIALLLAGLFATLSIHHENVYWISGQSSLLAFVFLFGSIYIFQCLRVSAQRGRYLWQGVGVVLIFFSMLSYDGMMVAPIILWVLETYLYKQKTIYRHGILLLIPLYWILRTRAGAVMPSGDYGYRPSTFIVNTLANSVGYFFAIFGGPRVIEYWESLRSIFRTNKHYVMVVIGFLIVGLGYILTKLRLIAMRLRVPIIWFCCFLLSLGAYVGLGGMAERYAFIPSGFLIITVAICFEKIWQKRRLAVKLILCMGIAALIYWNYQESYRIKEDWDKASSISEQTLLQLRKEYFPLTNHRAFIFVNTPIRIGRAWIFPTGLQDALWHVFRLNPFSYTTIFAKSVAEASSYPGTFNGYNREVFMFQDMQLKRLIVETKIVEE